MRLSSTAGGSGGWGSTSFLTWFSMDAQQTGPSGAPRRPSTRTAASCMLICRIFYRHLSYFWLLWYTIVCLLPTVSRILQEMTDPSQNNKMMRQIDRTAKCQPFWQGIILPIEIASPFLFGLTIWYRGYSCCSSCGGFFHARRGFPWRFLRHWEADKIGSIRT